MNATTKNGYKYEIKNKICTLFIPINQGLFNPEVQKAQNEICLNDDLPYFKEVQIKKVGNIVL